MSSATFDDLMACAEDELWLAFKLSRSKQHSVSRGSSREEALTSFIAARLPARFGVTTGEAIDAKERRTGQLDIVVFDRHLTAPLLAEKTGDVLPAESLLAVIEVKSKLTKNEMETCARAAKAVARLRPYGQEFVGSRTEGSAADDGRHRCQYSVVAFESDLAAASWPQNEWERLKAASIAANVPRERIDRVLVLDRGMLVPTSGSAQSMSAPAKTLLRDWFLHMTNFVVREASRRPNFDYQDYGRVRRNPGWTKLA